MASNVDGLGFNDTSQNVTKIWANALLLQMEGFRSTGGPTTASSMRTTHIPA